jgi:hypothetical protein
MDIARIKRRNDLDAISGPRLATKKGKESTMTIEERLSSLELEIRRIKRRNRWLLATALFLLTLLPFLRIAAIKAGAQSTELAGEIHAKKFVLEDQNGRTRASLEINDLGPTLALKDENGKDRVLLSIWKETNPCLHLIDDRGIYRVSVSASGPNMILRDEQSFAGFIISADNGGSEISMSERTGQFRSTFFVRDFGAELSIEHPKSGRAFEVRAVDDLLNLSLNDNAQRRAQMSLSDFGTSLRFFDHEGNERLSAGRQSVFKEDGTRITYPESSILLFGPDGSIIWSAIK